MVWCKNGLSFILHSLKAGECAECELVTMSVMTLWTPTDGKQANEALFFQIYSKTSILTQNAPAIITS